MTKAERRELQEKQRAAKAAAKASGSTNQTNKPTAKPEGSGEKSAGKQSGKQNPGTGPSAHPQTQHVRRGSRVGGEIPRPGGGLGGNIVSDLASRNVNPRGVRIFSHFGLQQKSGTGKGLIHPAIVRLGLLFADFRITGANARCLATLTAFKHVRRFLSSYPSVTDCGSGHPRLHHTPEQHAVSALDDTLVRSNQSPRRRQADVRHHG